MSNPFADAFKDAGLIDKKEHQQIQNQDKNQAEQKKNQVKYGKIASFYKDWFFNNDWEVNPELFDTIANQVVDSFEKSKLTSRKLRQYYDIVNWLYHTKVFESKWKLKTELFMMIAKANYDYGRKQVVPLSFVQFLKFNIDNLFIKSDKKHKDKFIIFKKHMEAVVAYSKWKLKN